MAQELKSPKDASYDAYFEIVQSRKTLPQSLQETLTAAFARIPVSSFPGVPGGKGNRGSCIRLQMWYFVVQACNVG